MKIDKLWRHAEVLSKSRGDLVNLHCSSTARAPLERMTDVLSVAIAPCGFRRDHIGLLIAPGSATAHTESVTSDVALQFATSMLRRFDVDWDAAGFSDDGLNELAEHLLRIIQSFVIDPGRPPRTGEDRRDYMRRWVGSAVGVVER